MALKCFVIILALPKNSDDGTKNVRNVIKSIQN